MTALDERIRRLTDEQLLALQRSFRSPPKTADLVQVIDRELESRHHRQRDQARLPVLLREISERMTGTEDITQISEAEKLALVLHKPSSLAARQIAARARGEPLPPPVPRRRFVPPVGSSDTPKNAPAKPAAPSNVVFLPELFGAHHQRRWIQGE